MDKTKAIRTIEHHLRSYKTYHIGIKNLQHTIDNIMPQMTTSYTLREGSSGTFDIHSTVEDAVLDRLESARAIYVKEQIRQLRLITNSIDRAMEALGDMERDFIKYRYLDGYSISKTAITLNVSDQMCFKLRNVTMDKLLISLSNIVKETV